MRRLLLFSWMLLLFSGIAFLFWHNEWKYNLPTPVPAGFIPIETKSIINFNTPFTSTGKPVFLHFFNPDCPCSRFNIPHFRSLVKEYRDRVDFTVVVMTKDASYTADEIRNKLGTDLPVIFDQSVAERCGVYSTPQAVIIDTDHSLYYKGNYNKSRYCTDKNSNYALMAMDSLLHNHHNPTFSLAAIKSYGCELPNCKK